MKKIQIALFALAMAAVPAGAHVFDDAVFYFFVNDRAVIIGRAQNPWAECDLARVNADGVQLGRRRDSRMDQDHRRAYGAFDRRHKRQLAEHKRPLQRSSETSAVQRQGLFQRYGYAYRRYVRQGKRWLWKGLHL